MDPNIIRARESVAAWEATVALRHQQLEAGDYPVKTEDPAYDETCTRTWLKFDEQELAAARQRLRIAASGAVGSA